MWSYSKEKWFMAPNLGQNLISKHVSLEGNPFQVCYNNYSSTCFQIQFIANISPTTMTRNASHIKRLATLLGIYIQVLRSDNRKGEKWKIQRTCTKFPFINQLIHFIVKYNGVTIPGFVGKYVLCGKYISEYFYRCGLMYVDLMYSISTLYRLFYEFLLAAIYFIHIRKSSRLALVFLTFSHYGAEISDQLNESIFYIFVVDQYQVVKSLVWFLSDLKLTSYPFVQILSSLMIYP